MFLVAAITFNGKAYVANGKAYSPREANALFGADACEEAYFGYCTAGTEVCTRCGTYFVMNDNVQLCRTCKRF